MKDKTAIAVLVGHGKATLTDAIINAIDKTEKVTKTIQVIIEEDRSFKITAPPELPSVVECNFKSGKERRREIQARKRKAKKHN